jgi:hypothetical protein
LSINIFPLYVLYTYPYQDLNDDSLITLTYAKNLAHGRGFVFNHEPPVLGTTTPLFTLLVTAIAILLPQVEIAWIALFLSILCWVGIEFVILLFRDTFELAMWQAAVLCIIIVASGWISNLGMEAYLFAFLLIVSIALFLNNHRFYAGVSAGLLFLTRYEGILVFCLLFSDDIIRHFIQEPNNALQIRKRILKLCVGFASIVIPWFLYAYLTFGSILPNTLAAKMAQGRLAFSRPFLQRLFYEWAPSWGKQLTWGRFPFVNLWWILVLIGLITVVVQKRKWLFFLIWILAYIGGYSILGVSAYAWYQLPIVFVANILLGLGLITCIEFLTKQKKLQWAGFISAIILTGVVAFNLVKPRFAATFYKQGDVRGASYRNL